MSIDLSDNGFYVSGYVIAVYARDNIRHIVGPFKNKADAELVASAWAEGDSDLAFFVWSMVGLAEFKEPPNV